MISIYGFRIAGAVYGQRRLIDWQKAFTAHAECDHRADTGIECFLSAFTFGEEFRCHLNQTGSTKNFVGPCGSSWLWFDLDGENGLESALTDARKLVGTLGERYSLDEELLIFFSGSKGFHVGLPLSVCDKPAPSLIFNRVCRILAEQLAIKATAKIDSGIYDAVRAFRAPNSKHPKTGLYKRILSLEELMQLNSEGIRQLATIPTPFDIPDPASVNTQATSDWDDAFSHVQQSSSARAERRAANPMPRINRSTLDFILHGAATGDRHRLLFSAAANLAEFDCPPALANALLTEAALDAGLSPSEVRRQIECGLQHQIRNGKN